MKINGDMNDTANLVKMLEGDEPANQTMEMRQPMTPQKPVNLLPEVPSQTSSRKLSDREQRDCDVIGRNFHRFLDANLSLN